MNLETRINIEKQIAFACVDAILAAELRISVFDGEAFALTKSKDAQAIKAALFSTDDDTLYVWRPTDVIHANGKRVYSQVGFISLVYGNDGYDVISDHTTGELERILKPAFDLADQLEKNHA